MSEFAYVLDNNGGYTTDNQGNYVSYLTIEDWEAYASGTDPDTLGPWVSGGSGTAAINGQSAYDGSNGLTLSNAHKQVWSNSGLDYYPQPGDEFEVYWQCTGQHSPEFWWSTSAGGQPGGRFQVEYFWDNTFQFRTYVSGSETHKVQSNDNPVSLSTNTWYKFRIKWQTPDIGFDIVAQIRDVNDNVLGSVAINDTTHSGSAIGFEADNTAGSTYWDKAQIIARN